MDQIWKNSIVGLKNAIYKFNPTAGFVHILTQNWVKITQPFYIYKNCTQRVYIYAVICKHVRLHK